MSAILLIETSSSVCSVAVSVDGEILYHVESNEPMQHARRLAIYVDKALNEMALREISLGAVAVSLGPGSYTGLRIGLSLAKGLCFAKDIPLIGISTLELLVVKAMLALNESEGDEIIVPMIDARRMEIYTGAYNLSLDPVILPKSVILDNYSFESLSDRRRVVFVGNGVNKAKDVIKLDNSEFLSDRMPVAMDMAPLAEKKLREKDFIDIAYSVPEYLKEYQATIPKNKVLGNL